MVNYTHGLVFLCACLLITNIYGKNYDYIVVGGGTSGCVVAEKLSRNPHVKVLLLEKGDDISDLMSPAVALWNAPIVGVSPANQSIVGSVNYYINLRTSQETAMGSRSLDWGVGEALGGGSTISGNAWGRVSVQDLAEWGSPLWTYNATLNDWKEVEKCQGGGPACDPAYHGLNGDIASNIFSPNSHLEKITSATKNVFGLNINQDVNGPVSAGVGYLPRNVEVVNGTPYRQDTYSRVLKPVLSSRPNLTVKTGALVTKLNLKNNGKNKVIYEHEGASETDTAKREVIVSLGTFATPQLLLLSGIGAPAKLEALGIEVQVSNNEVGENLKDSVLSSMVFTCVNSNATNNTPGAISVAYYKSPGYVGNTTNMEVAFASVSPNGNTFLVQLTHMRHSGVGKVFLQTSNPNYRPGVTFNIYSNPFEALALVDQINKTRQVFASLLAQGLFFFEISPGTQRLSTTASVQDYLTYLSQVAVAEGHAVGTCSIGKVVDERLRLIDGLGNVVPGIRVIDNSVVPIAYSTHATTSGAMLIGKVGSRFIEEDWANTKRSFLDSFSDVYEEMTN